MLDQNRVPSTTTPKFIYSKTNGPEKLYASKANSHIQLKGKADVSLAKDKNTCV